MRNQRGVTLIEILAVVIILGVLSAIAVPSVYGYIERAKETQFILYATNIKAAAVNIYDKHPSYKDLSSGATRNETITMAIAEEMGTTWYSPYSQKYMVTGVSIPSASMTYISVSNDGKVYMKGDHVLQTTGEKLSLDLGYGKLATPKEARDDPALKNPNIHWTSYALNVGGHGGKPAGHLEILLYSFED